MPKFKNFYETLQECSMRLRKTVVMYDSKPYYVYAVKGHPDGKFRVYMDELGHGASPRDRYGRYLPGWDNTSEALDKFISSSKNKTMIRKFATSRKFNRFRPFPLGNVNLEGSVIYCERSPTRNMHQGLIAEAIMSSPVSTSPNRDTKISRSLNYCPSIFSPEFRDMLVGDYPSFQEVFKALQDPEVTNRGVAFHRHWSLFRGPAGSMVLCHKNEGVGLLVPGLDKIMLGSNFKYLSETIEELCLDMPLEITQVGDY